MSTWNLIAHGDAREGMWRGNWRMEWVASTLHTTSEHGASSITNADAHTWADSSRLNWHPGRFKWTRPFCWKTKSGFCPCAITFQPAPSEYWTVGKIQKPTNPMWNNIFSNTSAFYKHWQNSTLDVKEHGNISLYIFCVNAVNSMYEPCTYPVSLRMKKQTIF